MNAFVTMASFLLVVLGSSACNTMKGVGKDVERGGEKVQDAATGAQNPPKQSY